MSRLGIAKTVDKQTNRPLIMFSKPTHEQALALAAIFQACEVVAQLAHSGESNEQVMEFTMATLLNQHPSSITDLYGSKENLASGIKGIEVFFADNKKQTPTDEHREIINYMMSTIHLASKLGKNTMLLERISRGIEDANIQAQHFSVTHENVYSNIASLYQDNISKMRLKIQVIGSGLYLQQAAIAARIRCMLFAAIRNAFLWRQLGGKRRHLLLQRRLLLEKLADC